MTKEKDMVYRDMTVRGRGQIKRKPENETGHCRLDQSSYVNAMTVTEDRYRQALLTTNLSSSSARNIRRRQPGTYIMGGLGVLTP